MDESLGEIIIGALEGTANFIAGKSKHGTSRLEKWLGWAKWLLALGCIIALIIAIFVVLHFVLGPDAQGNSRVF